MTERPATGLAPGLYVVATPIGNLEDITLRAIATLRAVDLIACEDTRHTGQLLKHLTIANRLTSFHEYNKHRETPRLVAQIQNGMRLALVSDAGTPGISDPGYYLIRECIARGLRVVCIPGASALLTALVGAGLPCDHFIFEGFPPKRAGRKLKRLKELAGERRTMVFYESPYRLVRTLIDFETVFGDRPVVVCRELTKFHEEYLRGSLSSVRAALATRPIRGEVVIVLGGLPDPA